ncbi:hypothetical protein [Streptacidiphilus sp. EB129]|uniref:hypothetical protein n=1 Tax=Streptacidiphilus sp. EB129 TaxID=3156262 RepID=UPI003515C4CE
MRLHRGLVRLYPAAFRDRWGAALVEEAQAAGWRAWPNLLAGIADMWLHPAVWPAESRAQRRERAAALAITVAVLAGLFGYVAGEQGVPLSSAPGGGWTGKACTVLLLLGLALVAPLPRPTRAAVTVLLARAVRRLGGPAVLVAGLVAAMHLAPREVAAAPWHGLVVAYWWTVLAVGAVQLSRIFAGLGGTVIVAPRSGRLLAGMWSLTATSVLVGSIVLGTSAARPAPDRIAVAAGAALVLLAWALTTTLRDLRSVTAD